MGIFNTKQPSTDSASGVADNPVPGAADATDNTTFSSPAASVPPDAPATDNFATQTAPPLDDSSPVTGTEDNGGYIVTDLPASQQVADTSAQDETAHLDTSVPSMPDPIDVSEAQSQVESSMPSTSIPVADTADNLSDANTESPSDLDAIKKQAIMQLSPLVSKLDQSPEEKFHTAMMMLQATDDKSLVSTAYQAAQEITDEKAKAQALLDIVNEINYLDQNSSNQ